MHARKQRVIDPHTFGQLKPGWLRVEVVRSALGGGDYYPEGRRTPFVLALLQFPQISRSKKIPRDRSIGIPADPDVDRRCFSAGLAVSNVQPDRAQRMRSAQAAIDTGDEKIDPGST